ncbi:MAG: hypothetical protein ACFCU6_02040 [Balneolaceae bacterium]
MDQNSGAEGYVFTSYGKVKYLRDAVVAAETIRRYDKSRPIALFCSSDHIRELKKANLADRFTILKELSPQHQSIVGFKHNLHLYMPFQRNMYLDSDMIWCRNPDKLWHDFNPYPYTITGQESADVFFGAHKHIGVLMDIILRRRQRTLERFGLTHLYRVQTGIMYAADKKVTKQVNELATDYLQQQHKTHFVSRTKEAGRNLESCEWSLGMAMTKLRLFVYPWFNGEESPQLDFIEGLTVHDEEFRDVKCVYYCNPFIHGLRGIPSQRIRNLIMGLFYFMPRSRDHIMVTPYVLHFGWNHQKQHFNQFAETQWRMILDSSVK